MARTADPYYTFDVLITSPEPTLLDRLRRRMRSPNGLPHFASGLRWIAGSTADFDYSRPFDLVVVITESSVDISAAKRLASSLAQQPQPVILLTRPGLSAPHDQLRGVLIVEALNEDPIENLVQLAYTLLSPVLATALADLDWSGDVIAVLSAGSQALLVGAEAESGRAAITELRGKIERLPESHDPWRGAIGALASPECVSFALYHELLRWLEHRCDHAALVVLGLAQSDDADDQVHAGTLVITHPAAGSGVRCWHPAETTLTQGE